MFHAVRWFPSSIGVHFFRAQGFCRSHNPWVAQFFQLAVLFGLLGDGIRFLLGLAGGLNHAISIRSEFELKRGVAPPSGA